MWVFGRTLKGMGEANIVDCPMRSAKIHGSKVAYASVKTAGQQFVPSTGVGDATVHIVHNDPSRRGCRHHPQCSMSVWEGCDKRTYESHVKWLIPKPPKLVIFVCTDFQKNARYVVVSPTLQRSEAPPPSSKLHDTCLMFTWSVWRSGSCHPPHLSFGQSGHFHFAVHLGWSGTLSNQNIEHTPVTTSSASAPLGFTCQSWLSWTS